MAAASLLCGFKPLVEHPVSYIFQAGSASGAYLIAQSGLTGDWTAMIERLGLAIVLVAFFVWTGWEREKRMSKRIDYLEKQYTAVSGKLGGLTELVSETIRMNTETVAGMTKLIESRPCVAFQSYEEFHEWKRLHHQTP